MSIFHKKVYITRGIKDELPYEHQFFIVKYLHEYEQHLTDYLQVFEFYTENNQQWLLQRQEVPERESTVFVGLVNTEAIDRTVWVMEQGEGGFIILFPEDY